MPKIINKLQKGFQSTLALSPPLSPSTKATNLCFFSNNNQDANKLKTEEKKLFPQRNRRRFNYQANHTASLSFPFPTEELIKNNQLKSYLLKISKQSILEHASLRVDLFFYTLIAYYQKRLQLTAGHTYLQYGRGRGTEKRSITEACHNSLLPSLVDETIFLNAPKRCKQISILSGTYFMNNLNSTTELPPFVNNFDDTLELQCREKALDILRTVSLGINNPIEGLTLFLKLLKNVLDNLKQEAVTKKDHFKSELIDLMMQGTFSTHFNEETLTVNDEYIQLLMNLTPEEKKQCLNKQKQHEIYLEKFIDIQNEILATKAEFLRSDPRNQI